MRLETVYGWYPAMLEIEGMGAVTSEIGETWKKHVERTDMFSSKGSGASLFHIVWVVPFRTSRRKPLEATTSPNP